MGQWEAIPPPQPTPPPPALTPTHLLPDFVVAALVLAGVNPVGSFLQGQADYFATLNLPHWLIQWVSEEGGALRQRCAHLSGCLSPPTHQATFPPLNPLPACAGPPRQHGGRAAGHGHVRLWM